MFGLLVLYLCMVINHSVDARVGVYSTDQDSITVKMLNPGYIFNKLQNLCIKFDNDIELLLEHLPLYEEWLVKSDYLLEQSLEIYTYMCYVLLFKHEMHSYLQEDISYIISLIKRVSECYGAFMQQEQQRLENIHCIFLDNILKKIAYKALLFINLTKEVCVYIS